MTAHFIGHGRHPRSHAGSGRIVSLFTRFSPLTAAIRRGADRKRSWVKIRPSAVAIVLRASLALAVLAGAESAQAEHITVAGVACRTAAATTASVSRRFARGDQVDVQRTGSSWSLVTPGVCWVLSRYVAADGAMFVHGRYRNAALAVHGMQGHAAVRRTRSRPAATFASHRLARPARRMRGGRSAISGGSCPCGGRSVCVGPKGGRYCMTSGGNKRYGV